MSIGAPIYKSMRRTHEPGTNTPNVVMPNGLVPGDLILAYIACQESVSISGWDAGWTEIGEHAFGSLNVRGAWGWRLATDVNPTLVLNLGGVTEVDSYCIRVDNAHPTAPIHQYLEDETTGPVSIIQTIGPTPTVNNTLNFCGMVSRGGFPSVAIRGDNGWIQVGVNSTGSASLDMCNGVGRQTVNLAGPAGTCLMNSRQGGDGGIGQSISIAPRPRRLFVST